MKLYVPTYVHVHAYYNQKNGAWKTIHRKRKKLSLQPVDREKRTFLAITEDVPK